MLLNLGRRLHTFLDALASNAWFAYTTLFLLQFKVVYGMWFFRDLPAGDTSYYFSYSAIFHSTFQDEIAWSPLYTMFYGSLLNFSRDVYLITILHRLIIVFVVSLLLLALMRRLLPHSIAWLVAAWWVITPVNFDALYEVHLFALIPTLVLYLVALYKPTIWTRGAVLGLFVLFTVLVRNELAIATGLWVIICLLWEIYHGRREGWVSLLTYIRAYILPVLAAFVLIVLLYARAQTPFPELSDVLSRKHSLNVCQIYAYNYQQRYSDWRLSPWTQCQDLMTRVFGVPEPSMFEAFRLNPPAMLEYFAWNVSLIPDGVQVLLFNATAGSGQPDYIPRVTNAVYPLVFSILLLLVLLVGLVYIRRYDWWNRWIKARIWGWLAFLCMMVVMIVIMVMQRPRPSYLTNLFFLITALTGMGVFVIVDRWIGIKRFSLLMPIAAVVLIALVPSYFTPEYRNPDGAATRQLFQHYQRLKPFENLTREPGAHLLAWGWPYDLCNYLAVRGCTPTDYRDFVASKPADVSFGDWLTQQNITLFYVDEFVFGDDAVEEFLLSADAEGWETITSTQAENSHWRLLHRAPA